MSDLVIYIVKQLVLHPDDVTIEEEKAPGQVNLLLFVNPEDMGIVIGKGGQTIKAIRKILTTRAIVDRVRINLQLHEPADQQTGDPAESDQSEAQPEKSEDQKTGESENQNDSPESAEPEQEAIKD